MTRTTTNKKESIRVLIVDDHAIVRKGIRALLATEAGIHVVGEAYDGQTAILEAQRLQPDVVIMDLIMPGIDGLQAIQRISTLKTQTHILVLTSSSDVDKIFPAIRAGALGYLLKDSGPEELIRAIRQVAQGNSSLHPAIARYLLHEFREPSFDAGEEDPLTDREKEVLRLVAQGEQNQDIATRLSISEATVRTHVSHILTKLELSSRTQAALYALRTGLASLEDARAV